MNAKLKKGSALFFHLYNYYKKGLYKEELAPFLKGFQEAILQKKSSEMKSWIQKGLTLEKKLFPSGRYLRIAKRFLNHLFTISLILLWRQCWVEHYQVPTGSMRPTLKEYDRVVVSKNQFGINLPFSAKHLFFDPSTVQRGGIVTLTAENIDAPEKKIRYFYLFDGYKQYIKRLIGKPGDTLYFYGGKLYGIDREGKDITPEFRKEEWASLEHVPFIRWDYPSSIRDQSNRLSYTKIPLAELTVLPNGLAYGKLLLKPEEVQDYYQFFGFEHFGMCKILSEQGHLSLSIAHHPTIQEPRLVQIDQRKRAAIPGWSTSSLPLREEELKRLFSHLTTIRFVVKQEKAFPFSFDQTREGSLTLFHPELKGIPDGIYEFFDGIGYEIGFQGISSPLTKDHPLMQWNEERAIALFNMGFDFDLRVHLASTELFPRRYTYFRDGDLYVMGTLLFQKEDPILQSFIESEKLKKRPFVDQGAPLLPDGSINRDFLVRYGLKVPEGHYFCLGDNHAASGDCREFGFIPAENLRGRPSFIFAPTPSLPHQPRYPLLTSPRLIVWTLGLFIFILYNQYRKKYYTLPVLIE